MRYHGIGISLMGVSFIFYLLMETFELLYIEELPIYFSISKSFVLLCVDILILTAVRNKNSDCLFVITVIYLIYSCILFFFHLLLEINRHKDIEDRLLLNLIIVFNIFSAFLALFSSVFLFLYSNQIYQIKRNNFNNIRKYIVDKS
jgi:hypothetical protein